MFQQITKMNEMLDQTPNNDDDCKDLKKIPPKLRTISYTDKLVHYFYRPEDPSSLGVIRCLYGKYTMVSGLEWH